MVPLLLGEQAGDGSEPPFLVWLVKFRGGNTGIIETCANVLESVLVSAGQEND